MKRSTRLSNNFRCAWCKGHLGKHKARFCSKMCSDAHNRKRLQDVYHATKVLWVPELRNCKRCAVKFMPDLATRLYCSLECSRQGHNTYEKQQLEITCFKCHAVFTGSRRRRFCSLRCRRKHYANTPAGKLRRSRAAKRRYAKSADFRARAIQAVTRNYHINPVYRIRKNIRNRIKRMIFGRHAETRWVGCDTTSLRAWLESKFRSGMAWDNYGAVWVVDHKKPLASFDLSDCAQIEAACHYTNLQPLLRAENQAKAARLDWALK